MDGKTQAEAARRLAEAMELAGITVTAPHTEGGNVVGHKPVHPVMLLGVWQRQRWVIGIEQEHGARIVGRIGGEE